MLLNIRPGSEFNNSGLVYMHEYSVKEKVELLYITDTML